MVTGTAVAGIAVVALGLVLTPGPNMLYLVSRSVTQGRRAGLVSLLGVAAGFGVHLGASVGGLAAVFATVPAAYTVLKVAGAGNLLIWPGRRCGPVPSRCSRCGSCRSTRRGGCSPWVW